MRSTLASALKICERVETQLSLVDAQHILINDYAFKVISDLPVVYNPEPVCLSFHQSDDFVRLLIGPYGSGKSTAACAEIVRRACEMPACRDGIRRSKWAIVRNTAGELESTTLQTWIDWFGSLGHIESHKKPLLDYKHRFSDGWGEILLEIIFLALDREEDMRKLKSLELTGVYLNELSEIPAAALIHFRGRVNRFPSRKIISHKYWSGIIADTNPPDVDHWLYKLFEEHPEPGHRIFHQPPAMLLDEEAGQYKLNPAGENLSHLAPDYYQKMILGQTKEFINVYVLGKYGTVRTGKIVYEQYNDDLHAVDDIDVAPGIPVELAWDYGLTPACLITQFYDGQLLLIKEFTTERMGLEELANSLVKPYLDKMFSGCTLDSVGDPAGHSGNQNNALSNEWTLNQLGIETRSAKTNIIDVRIDSVKHFLNKLVDGKPALKISKKGCPQLRKGFLDKYCFKRLRVIGEDKYKDVPDKTHPFSDIQDCLQYICLEHSPISNPGLPEIDMSKFRVPTRTWGT